MYAIERKTIQHDGFTVTVEMVEDTDTTPFDFECYDESDIEAWRNEAWRYVGFVYTARREGVALGEASIWGTELDFPGDKMDGIDAWIAEDFYHPDLMSEAIDDARSTIKRLTA